MNNNQPEFYIGDVVTVAGRGDEHFIIVKLPVAKGGGYYVREAYVENLAELFVKTANITLHRSSPNRPKVTPATDKKVMRERKQRIDELLDAYIAYAALYWTLPDGLIRTMIGEMRLAAESELRELTERGVN